MLPVLEKPATAARTATVRVTMLDLAAMVPYYTGHLCASLEPLGDLRVTLASVTYGHDPGYFTHQGITRRDGLLDLSARLQWLAAPLRRVMKVSEYVANLAVLLRQFSKEKPDILHVQFLPLATYLPVERWFVERCREMGIRIVYTVHNVLPQDSGERHRETYGRLYGLADRLITHDMAAAERLEAEFGIAAECISVIPHGPLFGVKASHSETSARQRLGIPYSEPLVLWQGILRPYKGISLLLSAWRKVCTVYPRGLLAIVGTGEREYVKSVGREVRSQGLESRTRLVLRFVPLDELNAWFDAADILVYPYKEITTSGALMTGIGYGKPIVATRLPPFERILCDNSNALLVPRDDADALAGALLRLLRDPALRFALAHNLRKNEASLPRWDEIAALTRECYLAALSV